MSACARLFKSDIEDVRVLTVNMDREGAEEVTNGELGGDSSIGDDNSHATHRLREKGGMSAGSPVGEVKRPRSCNVD